MLDWIDALEALDKPARMECLAIGTIVASVGLQLVAWLARRVGFEQGRYLGRLEGERRAAEFTAKKESAASTADL